MIANLPQREEYLRKKRKRKLIKWGIGVFVFVVLVALSSYVSHRSELRISQVELSGGILVTGDEVSAKSLEYMKGSYFWLYPKNNSLWYPKKGLEEYLSESFKRIDTIKIHLKNAKTMVVEITERKPFALWCDTLPSGDTVEGQCYFIDQNSTIFAEAPQFSGDAYFKYFGNISSSTPIGAEYMASTTEFSEISDFVTAIKELSIKPVYLIAKENGEFSLVISGGGQIYFDDREPLSQALKNLESLLTAPELASSTSKNLPIDYIDLRYGNKLFYKLK